MHGGELPWEEPSLQLTVLADIHGSLTHLAAAEGDLREADVVVIAGDITNFGGAAPAASIIEPIETLNPNIIAVHGNCDRSDVTVYLVARGMAVHAQARQVAGLVFAGVGGALLWSGRTPNEADDTSMATDLEEAGRDLEALGQPAGRLVVVTHQPAFGTTLDSLTGPDHMGSRAIRAFIERYQPVLAVSGHLHERPGVDRIGPTTLVNPGPFKAGRYAVARIDEHGAAVELKTA
jgi:Icc-related predicted phosphoesterase